MNFDFDLVLDEEEIGGGMFTYYGLMTDFGSPADVLIRWDTDRRVQPEVKQVKAGLLAKEVVERWNAYPKAIKALQRVLEELPPDQFDYLSSKTQDDIIKIVTDFEGEPSE